jgi:hypothetical protein
MTPLSDELNIHVLLGCDNGFSQKASPMTEAIVAAEYGRNRWRRKIALPLTRAWNCLPMVVGPLSIRGRL